MQRTRSNSYLIFIATIGLFFLLSVSSSAEESVREQPVPRTDSYDKAVNEALDNYGEKKEKSVGSEMTEVNQPVSGKKHLKELRKDLKQIGIAKNKEDKDAIAIRYFEIGNALYNEGKFKEAWKEWKKAFKNAKNPQIKYQIKETFRKAKKEDADRKKKEKQERRNRLILEKAQKKEERRLNKRLKREQKKQRLQSQSKKPFDRPIIQLNKQPKSQEVMVLLEH